MYFSFGYCQVGQMMKIIEVLGMPPRLLLEKSRRWHVFFERTVDRTYVPKVSLSNESFSSHIETGLLR